MAHFFTLEDLDRWEEFGMPLEPPARLSVFGDPVAHSLSPQMHNPGIAACGIHAQYVRIHVTEPQFTSAMKRIHQLGFLGTNVTIPHKLAALQAVDQVDEKARRLGAVNTVLFRDGKSLGFNSDGPGFVRTVQEEFGAAVKDLRILILGAGGGAGRAVAVQCALEGCQELHLMNRTLDKVTALTVELQDLLPAGRIHPLPWEPTALERAVPQVDLIVNGTNLGMKAEDPEILPSGLLSRRQFVYDMVYKPLETPLLQVAAAAGCQCINGLPMLLHQGAVSFEWWFQRPAPIEAMRNGLLSAIG